jgi:phosphoglycerate dehydrogenase-like enzyme
MAHHTLLVLAQPGEKELAMLEALPDDTSIAAGETLEAFERLIEEADAVLMWSGTRDLLREVLPRAPRLRWVHSRSAGLDGVLFPELIDSPVVLTKRPCCSLPRTCAE